MQIKTFVAGNMAEALDQVRAALGPDAALIRTRMIQSGTTQHVEITAAFDALSHRNVPDHETIDRQVWGYVEGELGKAQRRIAQLQSEDPLSVWLKRADFLPDLADHLQGHLRSQENQLEKLQLILSENIRSGDGLLPLPDRPKRVALVGPPGAGKTTCLVKLAASAVSSTRSDIVLVNLDAFRPGAEEYLAQVGETLRVPVLSERTREVQKGLSDSDGLVLIDTDARIWASDPGAVALRTTLSRLRPDAIALVLPATWRSEDLEATCIRFQPTHPTHLVFSSLDQTIRYGGILSAAWQSRLPVACVTTTGRFDSGARIFRIEALMQQMQSLWPAAEQRKEPDLVN